VSPSGDGDHFSFDLHADSIARPTYHVPQVGGTLYIVGTPLGNLEDITRRAERVLREVDLIACEDTRRSGKLLELLGIPKRPLLSCHDHNEAERVPEILRRLQSGQSVALVSDAGMPLTSDPGYLLVRAAVEANVVVTPIPGPTAVSSALAASGLPARQYRFCGFLPPKSGQRQRALQALAAQDVTLVLYEAPHRIRRTLQDALDILGDRRAVLAREISKMHEEFLRGPLSVILAEVESRDHLKGEMTLVIAPAESDASAPLQPLPERVAELIAAGLPRMDALKQAAREHGLSKREAYRLVEEND